MLRFNPDFRAWAKELRERPVHKNPLAKREVVGAALNRLLRLAFTLVRKQTFYQTPHPVYKPGGSYNISGGQGDAAVPFGGPDNIGTNPCIKHGAPALLAKPA